MIKIGSKIIDTNVFLSPLSGCSDLAFRLICREHGAKFCFFEMIDANSIVRNCRKTYEILQTDKKDSPIAAQLLGSDPSMMADAAQKLLGTVDASFIDLNFACPAKKVIRRKAGAYLLKEPEKIKKIIRKVTALIKAPVTVKLRTGYDKPDADEIASTAMACESAGAKAIFVHGRTAVQGYSGDIDYLSIKKIKGSVGVPVIGNGNILNPQLAKRMFDEAGCDGIAVARGALGNPWIFRGISEYIENGAPPAEITKKLKMDVLKRHLSYIEKFKGAGKDGKAGFMRKIAIWYIRGLPGASRMRERICRAESAKDILELVDGY